MAKRKRKRLTKEALERCDKKRVDALQTSLDTLLEEVRRVEGELRRVQGKAAGGQRSKRTPRVEQTIFNALSVGLDFESAAQIVGVTPRTLFYWRNEDKDFDIECRKRMAMARVAYATRLLKEADRGNIAATIFWLKSRTTEFRPRTDRMVENNEEHDPDETFL